MKHSQFCSIENRDINVMVIPGIIGVNCHDHEARGRGQLSFDNPDVAMV